MARRGGGTSTSREAAQQLRDGDADGGKTLRDSAAEDVDHRARTTATVFGLKLGPGGLSSIQVFFRSRKRAGSSSASSWAATNRSSEPPAGGSGSRRGAGSSFYELRIAPPEVHVADGTRTEREALGDLAVVARRARQRAPPSCRSGARKARPGRSGELATRRSPYQNRFNQGTAGPSNEALETLQAVPQAWPALPRRIECFDISTIQGSETVGVDGSCAKTGPHAAAASIGSIEFGARGPRDFGALGTSGLAARLRSEFLRVPSPEPPSPEPRAPRETTISQQCMKVVPSALSQDASRRAGPVPGSGRHRRRQRPVGARHTRRSRKLGLANLVAIGIREEGKSSCTRPRSSTTMPIALPAKRAGAPPSCSRSGTRRIDSP